MNRTISDILVIVGLFLVLGAFCATGWLALPQEGSGVLPALAAVGILVVNSILLYVVNERLLSGTSLLVAVIYFVLATARPQALYYTPVHAASLLLTLSIVCYLHFNSMRTSMKYLVGAWACLGAAALILPPLAWLAPVYAMFSFGKTEDKLRFWVAALLSLLLPLAAWTGICYLRGESSVGTILQSLWEGMCAVQRPSFHYSAATMARLLLTAIAAVVAVIRVVRRLDSYKIAQFHACLRLIILSISLCVLTLLFFANPAIPSGLLTLIPVAPLLGEYLSHPVREKGTGLFALVLILLLVVERISCFV